METIPIADCGKVGFFKKTHGVFGELVLEFEPQFEYSVENADRFFVELEGLLVPFFIMEDGFLFKTENSAILTFVGVDSEKYAKRMVGSSVFLFKNEIIEMPVETFETYLVNYLLIDETRGEIGIIEQVDNYSGNIVLTVHYKNKELLVPFNEDFLIETDRKKRTLKLKLPEGLIEESDEG
ncbi:MAG: 16S rRNA processing protein [Prolixibacteraceae bacterium]|nr:MAG: 16S rRNA processing protein [Prolixibacteraceae bacterium]